MSAHPKRLKDIRNAFTALFPLAPFIDAQPIREKAARKSMGSMTAETAVWLCGIAHIRHEYTDYDLLMDEGYDQDSARFFVLDDINDVLTQWRSSRLMASQGKTQDMIQDTTQDMIQDMSEAEENGFDENAGEEMPEH